ncbi:hypothetical protein DM867_05940 [Halosegnis rubeus]|uniref:Uncharacterized protein n=1 Tax=Halosegnis rubeus TaxID=2212850 RepID=A0A5N5U7N3_9EURY|nr:hypothetical protein [Halosegnis rubeus]KAB7514656.1 hypothetical protein DM867_05940 [Halosegnis rubeus]
MTSRREIRDRTAALEDRTTEAGERLETVVGGGLMIATEPQLSAPVAAQGFVVEREARTHDTGHEDVVLHTTPSVSELRHSLLWYYPGPTAPREDLRILWADDRHDQVCAAATHPIIFDRPDPPPEPVVIKEGDGWRAVVPAARTIESMILRRGNAERSSHDIRGPVELPIADADEYDLVVLDAAPVPYDERVSHEDV